MYGRLTRFLLASLPRATNFLNQDMAKKQFFENECHIIKEIRKENIKNMNSNKISWNASQLADHYQTNSCKFKRKYFLTHFKTTFNVKFNVKNYFLILKFKYITLLFLLTSILLTKIQEYIFYQMFKIQMNEWHRQKYLKEKSSISK